MEFIIYQTEIEKLKNIFKNADIDEGFGYQKLSDLSNHDFKKGIEGIMQNETRINSNVNIIALIRQYAKSGGRAKSQLNSAQEEINYKEPIDTTDYVKYLTEVEQGFQGYGMAIEDIALDTLCEHHDKQPIIKRTIQNYSNTVEFCPRCDYLINKNKERVKANA